MQLLKQKCKINKRLLKISNIKRQEVHRFKVYSVPTFEIKTHKTVIEIQLVNI